MTSRTSGSAALNGRIAPSGVATLEPGPVVGPVRRIRPAATATASSDTSFVARPTFTAPSAGRVQRAVERTFTVIGDRLGMPARDAVVLLSLLAVVGTFLGTALAVTAEPAAPYVSQLEVQHADWLATQQAATVATTAP